MSATPLLTWEGGFLSVPCATKELKNRPPVYLEQGERSERRALGTADLAVPS